MEFPNFSSDITLEVLTRVSLQILSRSRLVCKEWNNITYKSCFIDQHCHRTGAIWGYFIQSLTKNDYSSTFVGLDNLNAGLSLDFLPARVKIEAASNQGILYCVSQEPQSPRNPRVPHYYVCKPSTKQWQIIPNPKTRYFTERSAIMVLKSNPLHYKIIRFSKPNYTSKYFNNLRCEIFDSKIWAWKEASEVQLPYSVMLNFNPAVLASGLIHWLTTDNCVFAFDAEKEIWTLFSLPDPIYENDDDDSIKKQLVELVEYKGRLALIYMGREESTAMELWVMEDYGGRVWNKIQTLSIEALRREEPHASPAAFYNADVALMKGFYQVIFYKFFNSSSSVVRLEKEVKEVFTFRSD